MNLKVLHVIPSFYPAVRFGGPILMGHGLCEALTHTGSTALRVLTTDSAGPRLYQRITWRETSNLSLSYHVQYCRRIASDSISLELLYYLKNELMWADIVHLTSVYSFPTPAVLLGARLLCKPVVWTPHGAFQWWRGMTKPLLKRCWVETCQALIGHRRFCIHFTSEWEKRESRRLLPLANNEVIPSGIDIPKIRKGGQSGRNGNLKLMFIGRIHPIKGLENLLKAISVISTFNWELNICGTGEHEYVDRIKRLCSELNLGSRVHFSGHLDGLEKYEAFMKADVCVVPSHTESFGNVVAEALAHAVPVIAGAGTPWAEIEQIGCGIWTPNDPLSLTKAITTIRSMDLHVMGMKGRAWMQRDFSWDSVAQRMLSLYERMVEAVHR